MARNRSADSGARNRAAMPSERSSTGASALHASDAAGGAIISPDPADATRRRLVIATWALGGVAAVGAATPLFESMKPSAAAREAMEPVNVDTSTIAAGELRTIAWAGKPVWLLKRTPEMIASLNRDTALLADPSSAHSVQPAGCRNAYRSLAPDVAVLLGVCTHLGCTPNLERAGAAAAAAALGSEWPGGFFCPCHGSKFDLAGRVFKGVPAPTNLVVPPYRYLSKSVVRVGDGSSS